MFLQVQLQVLGGANDLLRQTPKLITDETKAVYLKCDNKTIYNTIKKLSDSTGVQCRVQDFLKRSMFMLFYLIENSVGFGGQGSTTYNFYVFIFKPDIGRHYYNFPKPGVLLNIWILKIAGDFENWLGTLKPNNLTDVVLLSFILKVLGKRFMFGGRWTMEVSRD